MPGGVGRKPELELIIEPTEQTGCWDAFVLLLSPPQTALPLPSPALRAPASTLGRTKEGREAVCSVGDG